MAMYYLNPKRPGEKNRNLNPNGRKWRVPTEEESEGKFVVIYMPNSINGKYIIVVDGFENETGHRFCEAEIKNGKVDYVPVEIGQEADLWYSFDPSYCNFHIVPDEGTKFKSGEGAIILNCLTNKLGLIWDETDRIIKSNKEFATLVQKHNIPGFTGKYVRNHKYVSADTKKNQYLLSFSRLWCDSERDNAIFHIHNNFGQAQFMCYPKENKEKGEAGQINLFPDGATSGGGLKYKFELMYPSSGEDGEYNSKAGHLVYNAPYNINDCVEAIAKGFAGFIELCEIIGSGGANG